MTHEQQETTLKPALKTDPEVLTKLKEFDDHIDSFCLECGYEGPMGVAGMRFPWYDIGSFLIAAYFVGSNTTLLTLLAAFWIFFIIDYTKKLECPSCGNMKEKTE